MKAILDGILLCALLPACGAMNEDPPSYLNTSGSSDLKAERARMLEQTLGWNETLDSVKLGLAADSQVDGRKLGEIIGSVIAGRADNKLCSACHNNVEAAGGYGTDAAPGAADAKFNPKGKFGPSGRSWVGPGSWAEGFVTNKTKPANLQIMVQAWINSGYK